MSLEILYTETSLTDRVIIITGGGRGLGWVMAEALLKAGARVMATGARKGSELYDVREKATALVGSGRLITAQADVTVPQDCARVMADTLSAFGNCHALINNAARGPAEANADFVANPHKLWDVPVDAWRMILDTNVNGPFLMTQAVMSHFLKQDFGRVINISTSLSNMIRAGNASYGASKAALETASVQWANDLLDTGVTVNVLVPGGPTDTAMFPGADVGNRKDSSWLLRPEVMVAPALWLCSNLSNGVTGQRYIGKEWDVEADIDSAETACRQPSHAFPIIM